MDLNEKALEAAMESRGWPPEWRGLATEIISAYLKADGLTEAIKGDVGELVRQLRAYAHPYAYPTIYSRAADTLLSLSQDREGLNVALQVAHENLEAQQREIEWLRDNLTGCIKGREELGLELTDQQREIERLREGKAKKLNMDELWDLINSGAAQESGE